MMGLYAAGGLFGVAVMGQSGMEQLTQALAGDVDMGDVMRQAEQITGLGISATDAGVIIAALVFSMRVIDANRGLFVTLNDFLRKALGLHPNQPPPPPGGPQPPQKG
jgi:hypothetical protein